MLTTSNPIHPSVHALRHFTAASSFPSISTETFNPAPSQMTFFYLPGAFFTTANHRSVATSIYNFTPPKDFILYLEHWLVSTILEYCTAAHSVAPRDVPYLYELVPLPGKVQKSYRSGNNFAYKFWSPPFNIVINYLHRSVIYKYQRSGQLTNSNKYGNKYYSPYSAHTASRNIRSLWCWCLSSLHFTPILTPQPKASSIVMNLILS